MTDTGSVASLSRADFEALVDQAIDGIPAQLADTVENCVILVEDDPPPGQRLLGLYEGIPLTERGQGYAGVLPDRITLFRRPILAACSDVADVVQQVRITVVHEIAHHFGIDDERLEELGYA